MVDHHHVRKLAKLWSKVRSNFWRGIYLLGVFSFLLPFVSVKGCDSTEFVDYYGFQLIKEQDGWLFLFPICMGLVCFGLSFLRRQRGEILQGLLKSWKAVLSSAAGSIVVILPVMQFLFETVRTTVGQLLNVACWSLVYVVSLTGAFKCVFRIRRLRSLPTSAKIRRFVLLRVFHYLLAVFALLVPVAHYVFGMQDLNYLLWECLFSIPMFLAMYFVAEGVRNGERWALMCGASISFLALAGGVVGNVFLIRVDASLSLVTVVPASCLAGIVFLSSLSALKAYCIEYREYLMEGH